MRLTPARRQRMVMRSPATHGTWMHWMYGKHGWNNVFVLLPSLALFGGLHLDLGLCCSWSGKKESHIRGHVLTAAPLVYEANM